LTGDESTIHLFKRGSRKRKERELLESSTLFSLKKTAILRGKTGTGRKLKKSLVVPRAVTQKKFILNIDKLIP